MTTITDEQLHLYADRVKGKVVVITGNSDVQSYAQNSDVAWTGAANGIGRETALRFAKFG